MLQSSNNIKEYKTFVSNYKGGSISMDDYSDRNNTLSMALRELLSELDYNLDMHEAETRGETRGKAEGKTENTRELVLFNYKKGKSIEEIAEFLNIDVEAVNGILAVNN